MSLLVLKAYRQLAYFDLLISRRDFRSVHRAVQRCATQRQRASLDVLERACRAVDTASIWYWKEVLCLHRSAATACLLRRLGVPAQLLIGAQKLPFKAHAWVEVEGRVVNDRPYVREIFAIVDCW